MKLFEKLRQSQSGFAHASVALVLVAVIGIAGFAGYQVKQQHQVNADGLTTKSYCVNTLHRKWTASNPKNQAGWGNCSRACQPGYPHVVVANPFNRCAKAAAPAAKKIPTVTLTCPQFKSKFHNVKCAFKHISIGTQLSGLKNGQYTCNGNTPAKYKTVSRVSSAYGQKANFRTVHACK